MASGKWQIVNDKPEEGRKGGVGAGSAGEGRGSRLNDSADRDIRLNFVELCMFARFAHKMHV